MVLNWLKEVGTCNIRHERSNNQENVKHQHLYQDKSVYAFLINAARKTYQEFYGEN